jgi:hypothetical protein
MGAEKETIEKKRYQFTDYNLKKYFGLPSASELLNGEHSEWLDHYFIERITRSGEPLRAFDRVELISEPYQIGLGTAEFVVNLCKQYGLNLLFSGSAEHNAGCFRIEIYKGEL